MIIGLMPARNEGWVIGLSLRAALLWCDEIVCLDHASSDETLDVMHAVAEESGRVTVLRERNAEWAEMEHRHRMLQEARKRGAEYIAIVDADEVLTSNLVPSIRSLITQVQPGHLVQIPMRNMHRSITQFRSDGNSPFGRAITTIACGMHASLAWKDRNGYPHHQREPYYSQPSIRIRPQQMTGGVMHLQFASWRRLLAKHALYKVSERIRFPWKPVDQIERMYSQAPNESGLETTPAGADWWEKYTDLLHYLDLEREPWQEAETRRLVDHYGIEHFRGLSLYGVA